MLRRITLKRFKNDVIKNSEVNAMAVTCSIKPLSVYFFSSGTNFVYNAKADAASRCIGR